MGIGVSLILVAVGAILIWAVNTEVSGVELTTIGWILFIVGIAGALISMIFWSSWGGFRRRAAYVEGEPVRTTAAAAPRRTTVVEEEDVAPGPPPP